MSQSLSQQYIHLVFCTKFRQPLIHETLETQLHAYLSGALKNLGSPALIINSMPDHVHILFRLSKNYALAKIVEEIKKQSSKWMKSQGVINFRWQEGYGAFSISSYNIDMVTNYIKNQKEHHRKMDLKKEVRDLVRYNKLSEFNEKLFWNKEAAA